MNRKLIAIDIDGTLVGDDLKMGNVTSSVLRFLAQKGHHIILATGRPLRSALPYYESLGLSSPVIAYNGGLICNPSDQTFQKVEYVFPKDKIKEIYDEGKNFITSMHCETKGKIYTKRIDKYLDHYFPYSGMDVIDGDIENNLSDDCYAVIFRTAHKYDSSLEKIVVSHPGIGFRHWSSSFYSELCLPNINKGSALTEVIDRLGVNHDDIISFGDADNDYEMLKMSKYSFSMKGCKSKLLSESFPETIDAANNDGVGKTLQKLIELGIL